MTAGEIVILIGALLLIVGAGVFLLVRHFQRKKEEKERYDFTTKYGTRVMLSPQTSGITKDLIESWTDSVVNFWYEAKGWDKEKSHKMFAKTEIELYDEQYLERAGIKVNGIMWPSSCLIEIATLPKGSETMSLKRVASLFRHETSHIIAEYVGKVKSGKNFGEIHHQLFKEAGLGA